VVLLCAILFHKRDLWIGFGIGALSFVILWGNQFSPARVRQIPVKNSAILTIMTYNVLGLHEYTQPIIDTIREEKPDVLFLQELNLSLAQALQEYLQEEYPYQVLHAADSVTGIGVISKYPIQEAGTLPGEFWVGDPVLLDMQWNGRTIHLVNFHMFPSSQIKAPEVVSWHLSIREHQATTLNQYARQAGGPVIIGGDANTTPLNDAYKNLAADMTDAWRSAGFGLGHTFPGSDIPGSSRPRLGSWFVPPWLARIDYIFSSQHWETVHARLARFDGVSDHRGVIATLRLIQH
jgi:endonuclease/exonuclease/phosphatase (EEP) superfamily protein YafD